MRGRHIGEGDVVVAHAAQACQDLKGFASNCCHRIYGRYGYTWAKGVTMRSSPCLGVKMMRWGLEQMLSTT